MKVSSLSDPRIKWSGQFESRMKYVVNEKLSNPQFIENLEESEEYFDTKCISAASMSHRKQLWKVGSSFILWNLRTAETCFPLLIGST